MGKSQKLYLSIIILCFCLSCENKPSSNDITEKRVLAKKTYKKAIHFMQGSTPFQNGIAEAVAIDSTYQEAVYELSVAHLKRGMPNKWLPQYNKAVKLDSVTRIPWRGYLYLWFYRDYKKAIDDFDASDKLTPKYLDAPQGHSVDYWRGIAYLGLNNYGKSNWYFEKHIKKESEEFGEDYVDITAFLYNGIAYFESGNYENALINFEKQLKHGKNLSADAKYYKSIILKSKDKISEAKILIDSAIDDFNMGYYNNRAYVETLRQIYLEDLKNFKNQLTN